MLYYLLNLLNPALLNCWNRGFLRLAIGKTLRAQTQVTQEVFNLFITYNFSVEIKLGISLRRYVKKMYFAQFKQPTYSYKCNSVVSSRIIKRSLVCV